MQEHAANAHGRERRAALRAVRASPAAVALTLAAVTCAVLLGILGPRLRDRTGSVQGDPGLDELAAIAARYEEQMGLEAPFGEAQSSALPRVRELSASTVGERAAPDLSKAGWTAQDARNVELAPGTFATLVTYAGEDPGRALAVAMLRDTGHAVRHDGFGRAVPLAPGSEWTGEARAGSGARERAAYAHADGRILWIVLADRPADLPAVARLLE